MKNKKMEVTKKFYEYFIDKQFTDLTIIITNENDKNDEIKIDVHRLIVCANCLYFEKMLTGDFIEANKSIVKIDVPNTHIVYDIIMSFYGQNTNSKNYETWYHVLMKIKCMDYLGIKLNPFLPHNFCVPSEGFELLIDSINIIGYSDHNIKILAQNLPINCDLANFSNEIITKICNSAKKYCAVILDEDFIKIIDIDNKTVLKKIAIDDVDGIFDHCVCSPNGRYAALYGICGKICIYDLLFEKNIGYLENYSKGCDTLCYTNDNSKIIIAKNNKIRIFDAVSKQLIKKIKIKYNINTLCHFSDTNQIICGTIKGAAIINIENGEIIQNILGRGNITSINISPNGNNIVLCCKNNNNIISLWDKHLNKITHNIYVDCSFTCGSILNYANFTPCGKNIIFCTDERSIAIGMYNITKKLRHAYDHHDYVKIVKCTPDSKYIVYGGFGGQLCIKNIDANTTASIEINRVYLSNIDIIDYYDNPVILQHIYSQ
ncbi:WD40 family protein [Cotonvirus japonicus]|uniref:WD40 family protein n=1 Tax=Cotonvirus japonicus TaxID=2811091 RepID=A0ABM7NSP4_9VIRU|nr:WD40 family protein [Cotonvirus japonicus]BCS83131.1 WD40 family protein [Cotonvirus japonicus]